MSDKPYRVPPGWSDEAARLVWEWWRNVVAGEPCIAADIYGGYDDTHLAPEFAAALRMLADLGYMRRVSEEGVKGSDYYWSSEALMLRAWAAVGAPVLAPAEDGRPSLAEWVAAAEGSALGRPTRHRRIPGVQVRLASIADHMIRLGDDGAMVTRGHIVIGDVVACCATPADLRAALDKLAEDLK